MKAVHSIRQVRCPALLCLVLFLIPACSPYRTVELGGEVADAAGPFPEKVVEGARVELHLISGEIACGVYRGCRGDSILLRLSPKETWSRKEERSRTLAIAADEVVFVYELNSQYSPARFFAGVVVGFLLTYGIVILAVI